MSEEIEPTIASPTAPPAATSEVTPASHTSPAQKRKAESPAPSEDLRPSRSPKRARNDDEHDVEGRDPRTTNDAKSPPRPTTRSPPTREAEKAGDPSSSSPTSTRRPSTTTIPTTTSRDEERKRGRRLFGGLLSTLSQTTGPGPKTRAGRTTTTTTASAAAAGGGGGGGAAGLQQRRQEIEQRQQARAREQQREDDRQREARLAGLRRTRRVGQVRFEEAALRTRHVHLRDTAGFLVTRAEPRIYYLPWEMTEDQEDLIKDQKRDAEDTIEREMREFKKSKEERLRALGVQVPQELESEPPKPTEEAHRDENRSSQDMLDSDRPPGERGGERAGSSVSGGLPDRSPERERDDHAAVEPGESAALIGRIDHDEAGDVMVEDGEDTVIY